ncbi:MAG: lipocalin family protein [Gallionella sp.]|nr:lipocalin family protein [Gallionella sp.]
MSTISNKSFFSTAQQKLFTGLKKSRTHVRGVGDFLLRKKLPTLTPPSKQSDEHLRFKNPKEALLSWNCKQTQWWYFTGHLKDTSGRRFGFEVTFFERRTNWDYIVFFPSRVVRPRLFIAHFAISDFEHKDESKRFRYWDRGGYLENTGFASDEVFHVEVGGWSAFKNKAGDIHVNAAAAGNSLALTFEPVKELVYHCDGGYSQRSHDPDISSFYCTHTRLKTEGRIVVDGKVFEVEGLSWMDHEKMLVESTRFDNGWIWYSIQLDSGDDLMVYFLKDRHGKVDPVFSAGTWVSKSGEITRISFEDVERQVLDHWTSPSSGGKYPVHSKLRIPKLNLELEVIPLLNQSELDISRTSFWAYWEGAMEIKGTLDGNVVTGQGFLELVGYDNRIKSNILHFLFGPEPHRLG